MGTFSYTAEDIKKVIKIANIICPEALAMVDTYSKAAKEDIDCVYSIYRAELDKDIRIGFHSHSSRLNSVELADYFLDLTAGDDRDVIIDASLFGMGAAVEI